jgi:hypothetical protein
MELVRKIRQHGLVGSARKACELAGRKLQHGYYRWAARRATSYEAPTPAEHEHIERELRDLGVAIQDLVPSRSALEVFLAARYFTADAYDGVDASVWDEKMLEHWIAAERLGLMQFGKSDVYVDVAAGNSPWAKILRERLGIEAYAIDLEQVGAAFRHLPYYRTEDATATRFADASVRGASLQCAYEMFAGDDDVGLIEEFARILAPGGKAVVVPLYLHTHYCAYATPDYFGKGRADKDAREYVCRDWWGIPSARFYDAQHLQQRVLSRIERLGMQYRLSALRNKSELGDGIYCHFVLEIIR